MLRDLSESDIPALVNIELLTQLSPWSDDVFKKCIILGSQGWVMTFEHQVIGFAILFAKVGEGHILNIGVHPDYQRRGYGQQLMQKIMSFATEQALNVVFLEVRESNQVAIALYQKMGFKQIGLRKNYYGLDEEKRENALVFAKNLSY